MTGWHLSLRHSQIWNPDVSRCCKQFPCCEVCSSRISSFSRPSKQFQLHLENGAWTGKLLIRWCFHGRCGNGEKRSIIEIFVIIFWKVKVEKSTKIFENGFLEIFLVNFLFVVITAYKISANRLKRTRRLSPSWQGNNYGL